MSTPLRLDALVIGAGPGGYACGIRLAQLGVKAAVVEKAAMGGVCLNVGCIPSKAVITAAKTYEKTKTGAEMGILVDKARVDMAKLQAWKAGIVAKLSGGVTQLLKGNGATILTGEARFVGAPKGGYHQVEVSGPQGKTLVEAKHVVVATGSRPIEIPGFAFGQQVVDSTGALAFDAVPKHLVVVGGGYIGLELGTAYAKLGSQVTVLEGGPQLLPGNDPELVKVVERRLKAKGVIVHLNAKAKAATPNKKGVVVSAEVGGQALSVEADKVLVTVGRRPNSEGLGLEAVGLKPDAKGFIPTDARRATPVPGVWAIGDVAGQPMLAHKASMEAEVVAECIAGHEAIFDPSTVPAVIFTDPEIATCGLSAEQAKAEGHQVLVGKFPFAASGRALTTGDAEGFVKAVVDANTHQVLGYGIVGPQASDLVAEGTLALEMGAFVDDIGLTIHAHPTLPEALQEATKAAIGQAVHALNPKPASAKA